jgi:hypothetical protein
MYTTSYLNELSYSTYMICCRGWFLAAGCHAEAYMVPPKKVLAWLVK